MTTATKVDWSTAQMTKAAQNTETPASRVNVIRVPRKVIKKYWQSEPAWEDVEAACARGEDGLEPWIVMTNDTAPSTAAHVRKGLAFDGPMLRGKTLLFQQGW